MAQINLAETASITTPAAGSVGIYADTTGTPMLRLKDDAGNDRAIGGVRNASTTSQNVASTTRAYIAGTQLAIPKNKLQIGSAFQWSISMTKTNAGTATSLFDICVGTAGTTADTARCSFTKPIGTAVVDEGLVRIYAVVRSIGATGVLAAEFTLIHNLQITGHATIPCVCVNSVSAGFDMTVADLIVGVCITAGLNDNLTFQMVQAEAWNL